MDFLFFFLIIVGRERKVFELYIVKIKEVYGWKVSVKENSIDENILIIKVVLWKWIWFNL